jgi:predicted membrane protein
MTKHIEADPSRQSLLLTILFTILSFLFWGFLLVYIIKSPIFSQLKRDGQSIQVQQNPTATEFREVGIDDVQTAIVSTKVEEETITPISTSSSLTNDDLQTIVLHTMNNTIIRYFSTRYHKTTVYRRIIPVQKRSYC